MDFFLRPHLFRKESRPFGVKAVLAVSHAHIAPISSRVWTRPYGHTPAHRALSEFAFLAFTLHLHPQCIENGEDTRELSGGFNTSPVKGNALLPSPIKFCLSVFCAFQVKR